MTIYLVRHDDVGNAGYCYGQTDLDSRIEYAKTAQKLKRLLPEKPTQCITSPLKRCYKLAEQLYPGYELETDPNLREVHFGDWENTPWANIPRAFIDEWAKSPTDYEFPNGEALSDFRLRVELAYQHCAEYNRDTVIVTHAGVIRLLIALYTGRTWQSCLTFNVPLASIIQLKNGTAGQIQIPNH